MGNIIFIYEKKKYKPVSQCFTDFFFTSVTKYHGELLTLQLGGAVCDRPCPGHPAYRSDELRLAISVKDI